MKQYDKIKMYEGTFYTGMMIGRSHDWIYPEGKWHETKISPDKWSFSFESIKKRSFKSCDNTGASVGTVFHWYILADQKATKLDNDAYKTEMNGIKFKIGHKRPHWRNFSYDYEGQPSYSRKVQVALEETLRQLRGD